MGGGKILALNLAAGLVARGHGVFVFNQRAHLVDKALVQRLLPASVRLLSMVDRPVRSFGAYKLDAVRQRLARIQIRRNGANQQAGIAARFRFIFAAG